MNNDEKIKAAAEALATALTEAAGEGLDFMLELELISSMAMEDTAPRYAYLVHVIRRTEVRLS